MRLEGREAAQLRRVKITRNYIKHAEGSVLVEFGDTKVICTATVQNEVPPFLKKTGTGWVTAEYSMLPRSTAVRVPRDAVKGKVNGRSQEIQRLIGRGLRSIIDTKLLGERSILIDADVMQADGGTRTAAITGAYVALKDAVNKLMAAKTIEKNPLTGSVAAVSVGIVDGTALLDLDYSEDSKAEVDMNVVMTGSGEFIELQATAEKKAFDDKKMKLLIGLAKKGIRKLLKIQKNSLGEK